MTTAMIEITSYNTKTLTRTTFRPFAWFGWPMEFARIVIDTFTNAGKGIATSGGRVKRVTVNSPTGRITNRAIVTETSLLSPIFYHTTFNDPDDFQQAMKHD